MTVDRDILMTDLKVQKVGMEHPKAMELVSVGPPIPNHQVRIVDIDDNELPSNSVGSIQFNGPSATLGYFNRPDKTVELFHGEWLDTGDQGFISDGELYITGREKDIIIKAGRNIAPQELEESVGNLPEVRKGCVVAFAGEDENAHTEKLVIVAEVYPSFTAPEIQAQVKKNIQSLSIDLLNIAVDDIILVSPHTILKTSSGKVRRAACQKLYREKKLEDTPLGLMSNLYASSILLFKDYLKGRLFHFLKKLKYFLYFIYIWPIFLTIIPPIILLVIILPFDKKWKAIEYGVKFFLLLAGIRVKIHGRKHLYDLHGKYVFVSNHSSYLDAAVIASFLGRPLSFVAKQELKYNVIAKKVLVALRTIFVDRQDSDKAVEQIKNAKKEFNQEIHSLFVFPEGTFSRIPGLMPFKMGAFFMSAQLELPVVPITIHGTRSILLEGRTLFPRPGKITITISDPIEPNLDEPDKWQQALELKEKARKEMLNHCKEPDLAPTSKKK